MNEIMVVIGTVKENGHEVTSTADFKVLPNTIVGEAGL